MAKEFIEPEEKEFDISEEIMDDFNPLDEAIQEKAYTKPNVKFSASDMTSDIAEPSFIPPPMGGDSIKEDEKIKKQPQEPFNPQMKDLPKKDKHDAADKVANMIMTGYKFLNNYADSKLLFDEKKIKKLEITGELNLNVSVPISSNESISAGEFINEFNEQSKGTITVSKEFEDEVMPVLIEVLEKRGVGMSTEQYLAYLVGKDIAVKGFMVMQSLSVKKEMLNMLKELSVQQPQVQQPIRPTPQPQNAEPTYEQPRQQERNYSNEAPSVNDVVNQMTGGYEPTPQYQEDDMNYEEPIQQKVEVKIIKDAPKSTLGKRGRPKKK
jgi:hypothetical protein